MEKILMTLACTLSFFSLNGQIEFAPLGAKWYVKIYAQCFGGPNSQDEYFAREVTIDSMIQGKYCTRIDGVNGPDCVDYFYVHQDGEKVYVFSEGTGTFQLLYDFAAPVGASWDIAVCGLYDTDSMTMTVKEVGSDYQIVDLVPKDSNSSSWWRYENYTILKGIGGIFDNPLLFHTSEFVLSGCESRLLCYYTPSAGIIHINGPCEPNAVDETENKRDTHIHIYPNPASTEFSLLQNQPITRATKLVLFSGTGQRIMEWQLAKEGNGQKFSVAGLPNGLYYWVLVQEGKNLESGKLVIID